MIGFGLLDPAASAAEAAKGRSASGLVPLVIALPDQPFPGTPKDIPLSSYTEPYSDKLRPPLLVPAGLSNLARASKVTCSDTNVQGEALARITDGDKNSSGDSTVLLRKGKQYVQVDLGDSSELFAVVIWHAYNEHKVYHSVIVQLSDDPGFEKGTRTLFNNDQENKLGLGAGTDREYFETYQGKLIEARGARGRYLRFYTKGSTESPLNEYTEIEVYGRTSH
jgi:hypothetical protein